MMHVGKFVPGRFQHASSRGLIPGPEEAADKAKEKANQAEKEATEKMKAGAEHEVKEVHIRKEPKAGGGHHYSVKHAGGESHHEDFQSAEHEVHSALGEEPRIGSEPKEEPNANALGLAESGEGGEA